MHIHILGICGTFMGGIAIIAKALGHQVSGSDANVYPPMSTQLAQQGIELRSGYDPAHLQPCPDLVIIGNALSRGNPEVEAVLDQGLNYISAPQWLAEQVLSHKWVLAVSGTHGKTTTTSMLSWILQYCGYEPGFLIGGIALNFGVSARLGTSDFFVIEADEYDCAFFDKRSKFVHYRPKTLIMNNLEYDHADIFPDLAAIQRQFHHLVRTVPRQGLIIAPAEEAHLDQVLAMGCWTPVIRTNIATEAEWSAELLSSDGSQLAISLQSKVQGELHWSLIGKHNVYNALSAIAAAYHVGVLPQQAIEALSHFKNVKRRLEIIFDHESVTVYDDFAHHPTAIETTLAGLRQHIGQEKIIAVMEPRSNTMKMGIHQQQLLHSFTAADISIIYQPTELSWQLTGNDQIHICTDFQQIFTLLQAEIGDNKTHIVLMSNGSFGGIYQALIELLKRITQ